ncbi:MAG: hypothetical protein K1000chlam4_00597, partial [Chlamydiae bacterium]|nr:hypothetical protein [Chlamydiota bacterium]
GNTPLMRAAYNGDTDCVRLLLQIDGIDVNHANNNGDTALMQAVWNGHFECVRVLLKSGADFNHASNNGSTALIWAAGEGHVECVRLLLEKGANPNHANIHGATALRWAVDNDYANIVRILLEYGADPKHKDNKGTTALIWAARKGQLECVRLLLESGADFNHANNKGTTALIWAAGEGQLECVRLLLEKGANPNHANIHGATALRWAVDNDYADIVRILLEYGADPKHKDNKGISVIVRSSVAINTTRRVFSEFFWQKEMVREICFDANELCKYLTANQILEKLLTSNLFSRMLNPWRQQFLGPIEELFVTVFNFDDLKKLKGIKDFLDSFDNTTLIYAAAKNRMDAVEMLLHEGVDLHHRNIAGDSAIDLAAKMGHMEVCLRLLKECHQRAPYVQAALLAAANGHADLLAQLYAAYSWLLESSKSD